jgi:hypothetical protein
MFQQFSPYVLWLVVLCAGFARPMVAQTVPAASRPPGEPATRLVVLKNGEFLHGQVASAGERVLVTLPGREISLRQGDIDVVAGTLEEAYLLKREKTRPTDVEARLDLAAWCIRHQLWGIAKLELSAAAEGQKLSPRRVALERRLHEAVASEIPASPLAGQSRVTPSPLATNEAQRASANLRPGGADVKQATFSWPTAMPASGDQPAITNARPAARDAASRALTPPPSPAALERFIQGLPEDALEQFTKSVHPMLVRTCATAGCHAPGNATQFTLLRMPYGRAANRRLVHRNLHTTAQFVDFTRPEESRLLKVSGEPHGPLVAGVLGDASSPKYRELVAWISSLTGVAMVKAGGPHIDGTANVDWDYAQQSADRLAPVAKHAVVGSAADGLQPNRPAEIKSAESRVPDSRKGRIARQGSKGNPNR